MLRTHAYLPWLLTLILLPASALAEVYRVVDKDGNIIFTDNPPADNPTTETIDLPTVNTQPSTPAPALSKKSEEEESEISYSNVAITSPIDGSTVPPGQLTVNIQIKTEPALQMGHSVQLWFDNKPYSKATPALNFQIGALERGEHSLQAKILDQDGTTVASSESVTFYVKRAFIKSN